MTAFADAHHRPHARHFGETPTTRITRGPDALIVTLDNWPLIEENLFPSLYDALVSNWGEVPSRTVYQSCRYEREAYSNAIAHMQSADHKTGWCRLTDEQQAYVEACFAGKTLQQALERFTFSFCVDGCTRAETHQMVRTRVGAGFMQHGGRDNDWRHRGWTMPETIARACDADEAKRQADENIGDGRPEHLYPKLVNEREVCIRDWKPIERLVDTSVEDSLRTTIQAYLQHGKDVYAALVDAGIPWQDARRLLWMGTQTYIHADYNYVSLKGVLANRLEHIMDWEINCVAQLMLREVRMKCPSLFSKYLGSHSDTLRRAAFAGLESWPTDGKWENPFERCAVCKQPKNAPAHEPDGQFSTEAMTRHAYVGADGLQREHTAVQMPFWVLSERAMQGGPLEWIWTNGVHPAKEVTR